MSGEMDLLGQIMTANVTAAYNTSNRLIAGIERERNNMAKAFAALYDALDAIPDHSRSVLIERYLSVYVHTRSTAQACADDPHPYSGVLSSQVRS